MASPDGSEAVVFAVGRVLDGRSLTLPFVLAEGQYDAHTLYTGGSADTAYSGAELTGLGLPLPAVRGDLPGCLIYLKNRV